MVRHICRALDLKLAFHDVAIQRCEPLVNSNFLMTESDVEDIVDLLDTLQDQASLRGSIVQRE